MNPKTKVCKVCKKRKRIKYFHKNSSYIRLYINQCKNCVRDQKKIYREKNKDILKLKGRQNWAKNRDKYLERKKEYYLENRNKILKKGRQERKNGIKKMKTSYIIKRCRLYNLARNAGKRALRYVKRYNIKKQPCHYCDNNRLIQIHHWDYSTPLIFEWVCRDCHYAIHLLLRYFGINLYQKTGATSQLYLLKKAVCGGGLKIYENRLISNRF